MLHWIFQANPKLYDLEAAIATGVDRNWAMNQGRHVVSPGDRVYFWVAGTSARLVAVGSVTSPVYQREESQFGKYAVDVTYEYVVKPPLTREEIQSGISPVLQGFKPLSGFMGTNLRVADSSVIAAIDEALRDRLMPLVPTVALGIAAKELDPQVELDSAIKHARRQVAAALKQRVVDMNPTAFEWLIRALLLALGYTDISVTKQSNDGGIDLRATLVAGGIANIRTAVQAKRTASVGRPVVQALRGSLSAHESGLLVTSGRFTDEAKTEAQEVTRAAIALVNGDKLIDLLLEHQIGATERRYTLYTLDPGALELESLKARTEST